MKTNIVKKRVVFALCGVSAALASSVVIAAEHQKAKDTEAIGNTLRQFYAATSRVDKKALKQTVGWPLMVVPDTNETKQQAFVYSGESDFDEATQTEKGPAPVKLSNLEVRFLSGNVASVMYKCSIPREIVSKTKTTPARTLSLVTILQKQKTWRIIFTTLPS